MIVGSTTVVYLPENCCNTLQQRIADFIIRHNDSAQPIKWSYTVAQMMEKFATN